MAQDRGEGPFLHPSRPQELALNREGPNGPGKLPAEAFKPIGTHAPLSPSDANSRLPGLRVSAHGCILSLLPSSPLSLCAPLLFPPLPSRDLAFQIKPDCNKG